MGLVDSNPDKYLPRSLNGALVTESAAASKDAFGRARVSMPFTQFDYQNQYNTGDLIWSSTTAQSGLYTHQPNTSTVLLSTGSTSSGSAISRQTKRYLRYTSGKSIQPIMTFCFGTLTVNVRRRVGYFDVSNGVYLEQDNGTVYLVLRSKSSGSVVNTRVAQSAWNGDRLDGYTDSGINIDWTKSIIFFMDIQWLGVGSIRCGIEYNGIPYIIHCFDHSNAITGTYMTTANLPIRYEIENTGVASAAATMQQICSAVITEGGEPEAGFYTHGAGNGITSVSVTTRRPVFSIRPKATINSIINRAWVEVSDISITAAGNSVYYEVVYNATLAGASFTSVGDNSAIEFDVAATAATAGEVILAGYAISGTGVARGIVDKSIASQYPITLDAAGANPAGISIICTSFTGTATVNVAANWREYY